MVVMYCEMDHCDALSNVMATCGALKWYCLFCSFVLYVENQASWLDCQYQGHLSVGIFVRTWHINVTDNIIVKFQWFQLNFHVQKNKFIRQSVCRKNKRNQLKIKETKVYIQKQPMTSCGSIKTKIYGWRFALAKLWYKIENHQHMSSSWKWKVTFTFSPAMKCKQLQIYCPLTALEPRCVLCRKW